MLSLRENLLAALRVFRRSVAPSDDLLGAGRHQLQGREVAVEDRNVFYILLVEFGRDIGAVRFQLRSFGGDFDLFAVGADLELAIHVRAGVSSHVNVFKFETFEAGGFDLDGVGVRD